MRLSRKTAAAIGSAAAMTVALGVSVLAAAPAFAGNPLQCPSTAQCGFNDPNYDATFFQAGADQFTLPSQWNNHTSSYVNQLNVTMQLWDNNGCTGSSLTVGAHDVRVNLTNNSFDNILGCTKRF